MPLSASFQVLVSAMESPATGVSELVAQAVRINKSYSVALGDGTGANQADRMFADQRTLADGGNETLDCSGLLAPFFGATALALVRLKAFLFHSLPTNTTNLTVSRGATNGALLFTAVSSGVAAIKPGAMFLWCDPSATAVGVTAGTADLITVTNSAGAAATYDVYIIGSSA
jgi:hypothetical protein